MRRFLSAALVTSALVASPASAQAPSAKPDSAKTGAIAGVVRDTSGRNIVGAELIVDGFARKAVTDDSGRFHLDGIPAGKNGFLFGKLGLSPVSFETSLAADKTLVLAINMQPADQVTVLAIEVYRTAVSVPQEFNAPLAEKAPGARTLTAKAGCGAIVVWTKAKAY